MRDSLKIVQCKECESLFFVGRHSHAKVCSKTCRRRRDNRQRRLKKQYPELYPKNVKCKVCHSVFVKVNRHQVYCSLACRIVGGRVLRRIRSKRLRRGQEFLNVQVKRYLGLHELDWGKRRELEIERDIKKLEVKVK